MVQDIGENRQTAHAIVHLLEFPDRVRPTLVRGVIDYNDGRLVLYPSETVRKGGTFFFAGGSIVDLLLFAFAFSVVKSCLSIVSTVGQIVPPNRTSQSYLSIVSTVVKSYLLWSNRTYCWSNRTSLSYLSYLSIVPLNRIYCGQIVSTVVKSYLSYLSYLSRTSLVPLSYLSRTSRCTPTSLPR
jgi:hypothetical protein